MKINGLALPLLLLGSGLVTRFLNEINDVTVTATIPGKQPYTREMTKGEVRPYVPPPSSIYIYGNKGSSSSALAKTRSLPPFLALPPLLRFGWEGVAA